MGEISLAVPTARLQCLGKVSRQGVFGINSHKYACTQRHIGIVAVADELLTRRVDIVDVALGVHQADKVAGAVNERVQIC